MNRLTFSASGNARSFYDSLTTRERESIDAAFDYIQDFPYEHGNTITRRFAAPVTWYEFNDGQWRILYTLENAPGAPLSKTISVFATGYA